MESEEIQDRTPSDNYSEPRSCSLLQNVSDPEARMDSNAGVESAINSLAGSRHSWQSSYSVGCYRTASESLHISRLDKFLIDSCGSPFDQEANQQADFSTSSEPYAPVVESPQITYIDPRQFSVTPHDFYTSNPQQHCINQCFDIIRPSPGTCDATGNGTAEEYKPSHGKQDIILDAEIEYGRQKVHQLDLAQQRYVRKDG